jgi:hypothetical protein
MSAKSKNVGPLPEGGEMLILAIFMFSSVVGIIMLLLQLAPKAH